MWIALDIMGGDHAPAEVLAGAAAALESNESLRLLLIGEKPVLEKSRADFSFPEGRVEFLTSGESILMSDNPLIKKPESSINLGLEQVKSGKASAFVSAGNTGALMSQSLLTLGRVAGVKRPAIATTIPKKNGFFLLLDAGANSECKPENLLQFARMGSIFLREVHGVASPKVGILNIGTEEKKGPREIQECFQLMRSAPEINFTGNIEGNALFFSDIDVVVADGFLGNVTLKLMEGFATFLLGLFDHALEEQAVCTKEQKNKVLYALSKKLDYSEYGGAPLLGVEGISIKAHGGSRKKAIANALKYAYLFSSSGTMNKIKESFKNE
ncbi:MAG: phosphate acyltransferase PlsX [Candidatus Wallbacteria bacterium]|nr:phosphate acyltransferase PlsX [Candidatus Wallbacteria bacterium]